MMFTQSPVTHLQYLGMIDSSSYTYEGMLMEDETTG